MDAWMVDGRADRATKESTIYFPFTFFNISHSEAMLYLERKSAKGVPSWLLRTARKQTSDSLETSTAHCEVWVVMALQTHYHNKAMRIINSNWNSLIKNKLPQLGICRFARGVFLLLSLRQYKS